MELRHLRYFVAVAEELSFRKAASRVSVSRPALSKQIKDLETEMGVRLLDRDTVRVTLTNAGEVFLEDSRRLLDQSQLAVERAHEAHAGHRGRLRIGSVGIIATDFLPRTLRIFREKYPAVEIVFVEMLPGEQPAALADGRIDIGFAYGPDLSDHHRLNGLCVLTSTYGVAVPIQHPLARRDPASVAELAGETFLCLGGDGRATHRGAILQIFSDEGAPAPVCRTISGFDSLITMIAADQGVSLLPRVLDLAQQNLVILPIVAAKAELDFHMWAVWKRQNLSRVIRHFLHLLEERVLANGAR